MYNNFCMEAVTTRLVLQVSLLLGRDTNCFNDTFGLCQADWTGHFCIHQDAPIRRNKTFSWIILKNV